LKLIANVKEALLNLSSSKMRSILALLGILVGTASVVAMVSGGQLATNEALKQFKTLGTDLLAVTVNDVPNEAHPANADISMTLPEAFAVANTDSQIRDIAPYTQLYNPIQYNGHTVNGGVLGVTEGFSQIVHITMAEGRFISSLDKFALFCVVGHQLYEQLKQISFVEPLGKQIQVGKDFFTIVGVADAWPENNFVYANVDNAILIPILSSMALSKYATINNFIVRLVPNADIEAVNNHIKSYVTKIMPSKSLYFRSAKELIASMSKQSKILTVFLGLIGSISLIVGGIGVMNIMLVSVIERRREIGIRLAVGARRADIRSLFLIEAVMLSLVGGMSGVVIGIIIEYIIALLWHWEFILFFWPPVIGFSVSAAIGIFFGFYPAYKASRLDPIEALRSD
jgi:putative ABC transport system permease protein